MISSGGTADPGRFGVNYRGESPREASIMR
jgi:hypothetical protein